MFVTKIYENRLTCQYQYCLCYDISHYNHMESILPFQLFARQIQLSAELYYTRWAAFKIV